MPVQNERFYKSRDSTAANTETKKKIDKIFMMNKENVIDLLKKAENVAFRIVMRGNRQKNIIFVH